MNSPYCGWNKDISNDSIEASEYDFLKFKEKGIVKKDGSEMYSYQNSAQKDPNQSE